MAVSRQKIEAIHALAERIAYELAEPFHWQTLQDELTEARERYGRRKGWS